MPASSSRLSSGGRASSAPMLPLLRAVDVNKAFGATQALRECSFELRAGEVHALVGENGSGKSTLMKIVSGVHAADSGSIEVGGSTVTVPNPRVARRYGIGTVFQEVLVAGSCSVLDNVWLGSDTWTHRTPLREKRRRAADTLERLLDRPIDLRRPVEELPLGDRQACCVARALVRRPRILILDEATAALDVATRDRLFEFVRELSAEGVGVIIITHRMDEISEIGDRITVLRSGHDVATLDHSAWNPDELIRLMTGGEALAEQGAARPKGVQEAPVPLVSVRNLRLRPESYPIDFTINAGDLIGVAGLEGHGGEEFLEALRGGGQADGEVVLYVGGGEGEVSIRSAHEAADLGVAYVPRDRRLESLVGWMSIRENFALPTLRQDRRLGVLSVRAASRRFAPYAKALGITFGDDNDSITTLSGGNQQKSIIARWLAARPRVLVLNDPTRGVSISTKRELYKLLTTLAEHGLAVVMLSTELDEHIELMDRVLVFREQNVSRVIERGSLSRDALLRGFFGEADEGAAA